jgi:hypothetical protein
MKSLLELIDVVVVETVHIELHNANDFVVVICSFGHGVPPMMSAIGQPEQDVAVTRLRRAPAHQVLATQFMQLGHQVGLARPTYTALGRRPPRLKPWKFSTRAICRPSI